MPPLRIPPEEYSAADDAFAKQLRGGGPVAIVATLILFIGNDYFVPIGALIALLWAWRSHTPWHELGFVRPRSWVLTVLGGIVFGVAFKFLMKAIVMPLLGAEPINQAYHYLAGNRAALPGAIYTLIVAAGFGEEVVYRGFLFTLLRKVFGQGPASQAMIVTTSASIFGLAHYWVQGIAGVEQAVVTGLVFGTMFVVTGQIWIGMFAHAAFDLTALAMIYLNLETRVAHLIFR
ncbi:MAG: lysostaphin resistance A-like protein [Gemmatimonadaceae bacterium]